MFKTSTAVAEELLGASVCWSSLRDCLSTHTSVGRDCFTRLRRGVVPARIAAKDLTLVGREDVDGVATTHLRGSAQPREAVEAGLGTQAQLAIARLPDLPVEVWVDDEGRPARIRYTVELPSLRGGTRTMVTTYDYRAWGEPVDLTP